MEYLTGIDLTAPGPDLTAVTAALERRYGVTITIHDCHALLFGRSDNDFPGARYSHTHPYCADGRKTVPGWRTNCNRACGFTVETESLREQRPFLHHCWKGAIELIVPIHRKGQQRLVIYAGCFRDPAIPPPEVLSPEWQVRYRALPPLDRTVCGELGRELLLLGQGFLYYAQQARTLNETEISRGVQIRRFVMLHAHEPVTINELAAELHLSPSRAGHLVKERFTVPFHELLEIERMNRAANLLAATDYTLNEIAAKLGYRNEFYFSRIFRRRHGIPPGRYRKERRGETPCRSTI